LLGSPEWGRGAAVSKHVPEQSGAVQDVALDPRARPKRSSAQPSTAILTNESPRSATVLADQHGTRKSAAFASHPAGIAALEPNVTRFLNRVGGSGPPGARRVAGPKPAIDEASP
jgi:hypothetical protein